MLPSVEQQKPLGDGRKMIKDRLTGKKAVKRRYQ